MSPDSKVSLEKPRFPLKKAGLMLINNPWGESNEKGLKAASKIENIEIVGIEKLES